MLGSSTYMANIPSSVNAKCTLTINVEKAILSSPICRLINSKGTLYTDYYFLVRRKRMCIQTIIFLLEEKGWYMWACNIVHLYAFTFTTVSCAKIWPIIVTAMMTNQYHVYSLLQCIIFTKAGNI